jgi:hypothetical protein
MRVMKYSVSAKVWKYKGHAGWYFITLPKALSKKIRSKHGISEEGWGRLKTTATIGKSKWKTAIWYDTKAQGYLLPLKSVIRKKEKIAADTNVKVRLEFDVDKSQHPLKHWLTDRKA